jgi:Xaa-Pro aminopeptidase
LPEFAGAGDTAQAQSAVIRAVAIGEITPTEGQALTAMLEAQRRAVEVEDLERRIAALEQRGTGR